MSGALELTQSQSWPSDAFCSQNYIELPGHIHTAGTTEGNHIITW